MGSTEENNLWYKGKGDILREFRKDAGSILSAVAARNFSALPGFAIEAMTDLEVQSKFKLRDHNQQIMTDAVDRELKALGLADDIAVRQSAMAWETEKQQLFSALQQEFADKDALRQLRAEEIESLMIDQEMREILVLLAKTDIELQIEDVRKQKEELGLLPIPVEERLIAAKLLTAQKKLDIIPYVLSALDAQRTVLDKEAADILPAREIKANFELQIADGTNTKILPLMTDQATAEATLIDAEESALPLQIEKAQKGLDLTVKQAEMLEPMTEKAEAIAVLTTARQGLLQPMLDKAAALEELADAEQELIDPLTRKAAKTMELTVKQAELLAPMTEKAEKTQELTNKQAELLDPMAQKAAATQAYTTALYRLFDPLRLKAQASSQLAAAMNAQLANHRAIAQEKIEQARARVEQLIEEIVLMGKEVTLDGKKITAEVNRAQLEVHRASARVEIADAIRNQLGEITTAILEVSSAELDHVRAIGANEIAVKRSHIEKVETARYAAQRTGIESETDAVKAMGADDRVHQNAMAQISAVAEITEKLVHTFV